MPWTSSWQIGKPDDLAYLVAFVAALRALHLGPGLALFLTLPYGKFVHGIYRALALVKYRREQTRPKHYEFAES